MIDKLLSLLKNDIGKRIVLNVFNFKIGMALLIASFRDKKIIASVIGIGLGIGILMSVPSNDQRIRRNQNLMNASVHLSDVSTANIIKFFNQVDPPDRTNFEGYAVSIYCQNHFPGAFKGIHIGGLPPGLPSYCYNAPAAIAYQPEVKKFFIGFLKNQFAGDRGYFKLFMFPNSKKLGLVHDSNPFFNTKERTDLGWIVIVGSILAYATFLNLFARKRAKISGEENLPIQAAFFLVSTVIPLISLLLYNRFVGIAWMQDPSQSSVNLIFAFAWVSLGLSFSIFIDKVSLSILRTGINFMKNPLGSLQTLGLVAGYEFLIWVLFSSKNTDRDTTFWILFLALIPSIVLGRITSLAIKKSIVKKEV